MFLFNLSENSMLTEMLTNLGAGLPKVIMAIIILLLGLFVAKMISKIIRKALEKINIDAIGEKLNEIDIVEKSNVKIKISAILSKVVYYLLILIFLIIAADILDMQAVSELVLSISTLIPKVIVAGVILIIGTLVADGVKGIAESTLGSLGIPSARMIASFIFYFLFITFIITALRQTDINTDFLEQNISLLIGGIVLAFAIGYGMASKSSMSNFLASYYSKGKFDIGDTITIDGVTGRIVDMDKSSLIIVGENNNKIIFPLNQVSNTKIEIHT